MLKVFCSPAMKDDPIFGAVKTCNLEVSEDLSFDFSMPGRIGVIYLSIKYHRLHPNDIFERIKTSKGYYKSRVLLLLVDGQNPDQTISKITSVGISNNFSTILAFSVGEAARWIEVFASSQNASLNFLRNNRETYAGQMVNALTSVGMKKTQSELLAGGFKTNADLICGSKDQLGELYSVMNDPI